MGVKFNKKQMDYLSHFEMSFRTAKADFIRTVAWNDVETVTAIWNDASGDTLQPIRGCGACTLELFKKVGEAYDAQRAEEARPKKTTKKVNNL